MSKNLQPARKAYAQQLAEEARTLVPGMKRLAEIADELRSDDLYRLLGWDTWEAFCSEYLGVSKSTANRWIATYKAPALGSGSAPKPKHETAGQKVAAAQNAPVVESDALKVEEAPPSTPKSTTADAAATSSPAPAIGPTATAIPSGASDADRTSTTSTNGRSGSGPTSPRTEPPARTKSDPEPPILSINGEVPEPLLVSDADGLRWLRSKSEAAIRSMGDPWRPAIQSEVERWALAMGLMRPKEPTTTRRAVGRMGLSGNLRVKPEVTKRPHDPTCSCLGCKPAKVAK